MTESQLDIESNNLIKIISSVLVCEENKDEIIGTVAVLVLDCHIRVADEGYFKAPRSGRSKMTAATASPRVDRDLDSHCAGGKIWRMLFGQ